MAAVAIGGSDAPATTLTKAIRKAAKCAATDAASALRDGTRKRTRTAVGAGTAIAPAAPTSVDDSVSWLAAAKKRAGPASETTGIKERRTRSQDEGSREPVRGRDGRRATGDLGPPLRTSSSSASVTAPPHPRQTSMLAPRTRTRRIGIWQPVQTYSPGRPAKAMSLRTRSSIPASAAISPASKNRLSHRRHTLASSRTPPGPQATHVSGALIFFPQAHAHLPGGMLCPRL